jgi:5-keto 4-deoxyuronate isomerase
LALAVFAFLDTGQRVWRRETALVNLKQQTQAAMAGMVRELRQKDRATPLTLTAGGAEVTFHMNGISNPVNYSLSNNQIIREHPVGTTRIIANNVDSLCFCWDSATLTCQTSCTDVLTVNIETVQNAGEEELSFILTERVRLRND